MAPLKLAQVLLCRWAPRPAGSTVSWSPRRSLPRQDSRGRRTSNPDLGPPVGWRYKRRDHALSFLCRSRPEPRLHLLSVGRVEVRYERVDAPKSHSNHAPTTPGRGRWCLEGNALVKIRLAPRPVVHRAHYNATL